jgi:hypothetical protein
MSSGPGGPGGSGLSETIHELIIALRHTEAVTEQLSERQAIFPGHPEENRGYPVAVVATPIYDGSTPGRDVITRDTRVQITVVATRGWREDRAPSPGGLAAMYNIVDEINAILETASGISKIPLGSEGGPAPQQMEDGRLAVPVDWRLRGFDPRDPDQGLEPDSSDSDED